MKKHSGPLRGGSWLDFDDNCHSSYRNYDNPGLRLNVIGFRLCARKPVMPETRALRGGSWVLNVNYCRSSCRNNLNPDDRISGIGFRLCARKYTD